MNLYFVDKNKQLEGAHDIHTFECSCLPAGDHRIFLGAFLTCQEALIEARQHFSAAVFQQAIIGYS